MNSSVCKFAIPLMCVLVSMLLLAACGGRGGGSKEDIAGQTWDCLAETDPDFEESMLRMMPTAENLDEAKEQYVYVSSAASLEELKEAREFACGEN